LPSSFNPYPGIPPATLLSNLVIIPGNWKRLNSQQFV
jgi:hypothetical protein